MLSKLLTGPQSQITLREVLQRTARIQHAEKENKREQSTFGLVFTHFFLSISGMSLLSAFSTMTYLPQHKYNGNSHHHPNAFSRPTNYVFFLGHMQDISKLRIFLFLLQYTYRYSIWILLSDTGRFRLPLFWNEERTRKEVLYSGLIFIIPHKEH